MNTVKPALPGMPVVALNQPAAPPAVKPEQKTALPEPALEIDLGSLLADQQQIDPGKRSASRFDVKTLNFEQLASKTLERVAQVRQLGADAAQSVVIRVGTSQIVVPSAQLNKEELVKILSEMLGKL
ncbi:MAG: hypothetical protein ACAI44_22995, partial [Candidatus Sericytochromatia bacterium]